jgi:YD repeat-containing protein
MIGGIALLGLILSLCFGLGGSPAVRAQAQATATPAKPSGSSSTDNAYVTTRNITLPDGKQLEETIIHGPPHPPAGFKRPTVSLSGSIQPLSVASLTVPAFDWSFGCSATSASMIAAYYDRNGYPKIYTGPTNGGVMPLDSSSWPDWTDGNGDSYGQCPLTASHNGLDGRLTRGSIDDYWVYYLSGVQDPFVNKWTEHAYGDAIGDYMRTSQSNYGNDDGSTVFYNWSSGSSQLTCADMLANNITEDGTYGRKLFYEARGYTVTDCYNQKTKTSGTGFTFAMYKAQIDAGRPVLINLAGHSIVGFGYDSASNTVYIHDTWDYLDHSMTWGGSYSGMAMQSVSIVNLAASPTRSLSVVKSGTGSGTVASLPAGISCGLTCAHAFAEGENVTLTATADSGSAFAGWSGDCSGTGACQVSLDASRSVTATFTIEETNLLGDVNRDQAVNSTDALIVLSGDVGIQIPQYCPANCGDVNADGLVNSTDALIILSYDVGKSVPFSLGSPGCPANVTPCQGCSP